MLIAFMLTPHAKALFGHTAAEKERRQDAEQRIVQEQQANGQLVLSNERLHVVISVLSAGAVVMLIVGAAVGSKTKKDHGTNL